MGGTSRSHQNGAEAANATPEPPRNEVKQLALKPVKPLPTEEPAERDGGGRFSDENGDRKLKSQKDKIARGETIATPGSRANSEDRDIHDEEWRAHDRNGPYGQRRRRRN